MTKPFWYTFYIGIAAGVLVGGIIRIGVFPVNISIITDSISNAIRIFNISPPDSLYFTIIAILALIAAILIAIYHAGKTLFDSGEYGMYGLGLGFLGGSLLIAGLFGIISIIGVALLVIGVGISYRIEREPPNSPGRIK